MNKVIAWALLVAVSALLAVGQTMSPQTDENRRVEQELRRLNTEEPDAFLRKDAKALATLWSDDLVVTNPLNKFVTKQQVFGDDRFWLVGDHVLRSEHRVHSGLWGYGDRGGKRDSSVGRQNGERWESRASPLYRGLDETNRTLARGRSARQHRAEAMTKITSA
jgi:hypothetical protein